MSLKGQEDWAKLKALMEEGLSGVAASKKLGHASSWASQVKRKYGQAEPISFPSKRRKTKMTRMEIPVIESVSSGKIVVMVAEASQLRSILEGLK